MIGKSQWWKNLENSETNSPIDFPSAAEKAVEGVVAVVVGGVGEAGLVHPVTGSDNQ